MTELTANDYSALLVEITLRISKAQYQALRSVNEELIRLYHEYSIRPKPQPLIAEISWAKNPVVLRRRQADFQRRLRLWDGGGQR